jgi:hypothetical protein
MRCVLAGLALLSATAAMAEVDVARDAQCLLVVEGQEVIRGPCSFTPLDTEGSFTVAGPDGKYFAYVLVTQPDRADGHWNGEPFAGHAHTPLGRLVRKDACWFNKTAMVCAW